MRLVYLKRQCLLWGYTSIGLVLLFIAGFVVSLWVGAESAQEIESYIESTSFGWWRIVIYGLLVLLWPRFLYWLTRRHQPGASYTASRRSLVILIVLYECLIVQNPLAILLEWVV